MSGTNCIVSKLYREQLYRKQIVEGLDEDILLTLEPWTSFLYPYMLVATSLPSYFHAPSPLAHRFIPFFFFFWGGGGVNGKVGFSLYGEKRFLKKDQKRIS